jgi:hypothetical protein
VIILSSREPETDVLRLRINDYRRFAVCDHRRLSDRPSAYPFGIIVLSILFVARILNLKQKQG